ncbi:prepilin-type cleavage/methylation domain-containing protein [Acinetobacter qingfengensis]|uniref:Uncharacterized protein n=1 Tax=Acinetobacter qingfengensis TaxID=1262585 RepID=A0A1E7R1B2_9GAMM|nr:prepilin-type N-terminal cleavage/methylation domain-containing protein [Acinetobacter qingfengensis]KAA8733283.1 prepilin-type cleavage/methylation domain-containing protein [Acinetobacter qingfengensis]OEY93086.1 hypothetical protein BJI46_04920 [Acinetobacter qingfengensis]
MKIKHLTNQYQQGVGLLEAMIAVLLSSILILGISYGMGRILTNQKQSNLQYIVVNQLRAKLQTATPAQKTKWCAGTEQPTITLPDQTTVLTITVTCPSVSVTVTSPTNNNANATISIQQPIKFSVQSDLLGGELVVGETL